MEETAAVLGTDNIRSLPKRTKTKGRGGYHPPTVSRDFSDSLGMTKFLKNTTLKCFRVVLCYYLLLIIGLARMPTSRSTYS